jgi:aspartyl protease family protein
MNQQQLPESDDQTVSIGRWMIIAMWILLLAGGTFFAQKWLEKRDRGQIPATMVGPDNRKSVVLDADRRGHYVVLGEINGQGVTFLVDTGASGVSVPASVAQDLNLIPGRAFPVSTANGTIMVRETMLDTLSIGNLTLYDQPASINGSMDGEVGLLGMSFLRHFELIQRNEQLTIREP